MHFVIDANAIKQYQEHKLADKNEIPDIMDDILTRGSIALDDKEKIYNEWMSCSSCSNTQHSLRDWIADQMQSGKIKVHAVKHRPEIKKKLQGFGVPAKDNVYILLACEIAAHSIVTNDIDLHDPTKKLCSSAVKDRIKQKKTGAVCKYLKKTHRVFVLCWEEVAYSLR